MITHAVTTVLILVISIAGAISPAPIEYVGGTLVVDYGIPMFQLNGVIFGGFSAHEYGHHLQQMELGDMVYYATVVLPSVAVNIAWALSAYVFDDPLFRVDRYYEIVPWERSANELAREHFAELPSRFDYYSFAWEYDATILGKQQER